jgi:Xaa-Pro aminopeptidase
VNGQTIVEQAAWNAELEAKHQKLVEWIRSKKVAGVLIRRNENVAWLTGGAVELRVLTPAETGVASLLVTAEGKRYLKWQPDWLDAGFSIRMERQLTTELPPSEQVRAILASLPLKEQFRVKDAIDRAGTNVPLPRKPTAASGPVSGSGNIPATRAGLITT